MSFEEGMEQIKLNHFEFSLSNLRNTKWRNTSQEQKQLASACCPKARQQRCHSILPDAHLVWKKSRPSLWHGELLLLQTWGTCYAISYMCECFDIFSDIRYTKLQYWCRWNTSYIWRCKRFCWFHTACTTCWMTTVHGWQHGKVSGRRQEHLYLHSSTKLTNCSSPFLQTAQHNFPVHQWKGNWYIIISPPSPCSVRLKAHWSWGRKSASQKRVRPERDGKTFYYILPLSQKRLNKRINKQQQINGDHQYPHERHRRPKIPSFERWKKVCLRVW